MLSDVLAVLIGFVAVMLLLSLVVTALSQASQSFLRLRGRNLARGLSSLLGHAQLGATEQERRATAREILERKALKSRRPRTPRLVGPSSSWLTSDEMLGGLMEVASKAPPGSAEGLPAQAPERIRTGFDAMEARLEQRFLLWMRILAVGWAVAIAVAFQVSTPELLSKLSSDPATRERYARAAVGLLPELEESVYELSRYVDVSDAALEKLAERHPDLRARLEEASGIAPTRSAIVDEVDLVLPADLAGRKAVVAEYQGLLDELLREQLGTSVEASRLAVSRLALFDIEPWAEGSSFYWIDGALRLNRIAGVLVTAIFLTFGAPFWFNQLRNLSSLRDVLARRPEEGKKAAEKSQKKGS